MSNEGNMIFANGKLIHRSDDAGGVRVTMSNETHSEKGLRELVGGWRKLGHEHATQPDGVNEAYGRGILRCADELEQALSATPAVEEPESRSIQHRKSLQRAVREPGPTRLTAALENLASVVREAKRHIYVPVEIVCALNAVDDARNPLLSSSSAGEAAPATPDMDPFTGWGVFEDAKPAPAATEKGEGK